MKTAEKYGHLVHLIESVDEFYDSIKSFGKVVGLDVETSGLDYNKDSIAGICYAGGPKLEGYYYPIDHIVGTNLPKEPIINWLNECYSGSNRKKIMLFNKNFDHSMLEKDGLVIPLMGDHHDVQVMAWLVMNEKYPALKAYCKRYFHIDVVDYNDVTGGKDFNFKHTDPTQSYTYSAADPVLTVMLGRKLWNDYPYIRKIYPLDNLTTEVARRMGKLEIEIDYDILKSYKVSEEKRLREIQNECYRLAGCEFKISSNRDKAEVLSRFVTLTKKTAKGAFQVNDEVLESIDHPLAKAISDYSKQKKFLSSYIDAFLAYEGLPVRSHMNLVSAPTGRVATGGVKGNDFYAKVNIMGIKKTKEVFYLHYDPNHPLLYYLDQNEEGAIGKQKCKAGMRKVFKAPDDSWFITSDFNSEEVMIAATLADESIHLDAIYHDVDAHLTTARVAFNTSDESKRDIIKTCNFLKGYGGGPSTLANRLKVSLQEAEQMFLNYDKALPNLKRWQDWIQKEGRRKGMVFTFFGRPRQVWQFYQSSDRSMREFADRTCLNSPVQGCLPIGAYAESYRKLFKLSSNVGKPIVLKDGTQGVPTLRGDGEMCFLYSKSGDFIVCDTNHGLVSKSKKTGGFLNHKVCNGLHEKVLTSKLQSKRLPNFFLFKHLTESFCISHLKSLVSHPTIEWDSSTNNAIWYLWLHNHKFYCDYLMAASIRSVGTIYGFNLKYDRHHDLFYFSKSRKRKVQIDFIKFLGRMSIATLSTLSGYQLYDSTGFVNKNTGADIMRQLMCKIYMAYEKDPSLQERFKFMWHVHDEINCYVKKNSLYEAFQFIQNTQTVVQENWKVPLMATTSIGTNWGTCLDAEYVNEKGQILPVRSVFFKEEDYRDAREKIGLPRDGERWLPKVVTDFYERHPYKTVHKDMFPD